MPRVLKPEQRVRGYRLVRELSRGAFANAYEAEDAVGTRFFLKHYKSPTPEVPWYRAFRAYQRELQSRLQKSPAGELVLTLKDSFEETVGSAALFQVFELFTGKDLARLLEEARRRPGSVPWKQRVIAARVLVAGLRLLHEAGVVHCDLKPENVYLLDDATLATGFRVKLVDLDFALLADRRAPWHGVQNYVGTPGYESPEHMREGATPSFASDVFTTALMLHELLGAGHPYAADESYRARVMAHAAGPLRFAGPLEDRVRTEELAALVHRALDPKPERRPTMAGLQDALLGRATTPAPRPTLPAPLPPRSAPRPPRRPPPPPVPGRGIRLVLVADPTRSLEFGVTTPVGHHLAARISEDGKFVSEQQYHLVRRDGGGWALRPSPSAHNGTLLNGAPVNEERELAPGDVVAVGRAERQAFAVRVELLTEAGP